MRVFILCLSLFVFAACTKNGPGSCPVHCDAPVPRIVFTGFAQHDLDSVSVRVFKKDELFDSLIQVLSYSQLDTISIPGTSIMGFTIPSLRSTYDYEIVIPPTVQTFRIAQHYSHLSDTFPCNYTRPCRQTYEGSTITGGGYEEYSNGPSDHYLNLKR